MRVNREIVSLKKSNSINKNEDSDEVFVNLSPQKRISAIWEITAEIWSLAGNKNVKRRLQRNIVHFHKA